MSTMSLNERSVKVSLPDLITSFLRDRGYDAATIKASRHNASVLAPGDAESVQRIVSDHFRPDPPKSDAPAEVDCLGWANDQLADPAAPARFRKLAVGLLNENLLGARFVPPVATETERIEVIGLSLAETQRRLDELDRRAAAPVDPWDVEADPADWPSDTDAFRWRVTDLDPEPTPEDLEFAAAMFAATTAVSAGLVPADLPAVCGGSPSPDERPVRLLAESNAAARARHHRGQPGLTDEDHVIATGCCG